MSSQVFSSAGFVRSTRLSGKALTLARAAWLIVLVLSVGLFLIAMPAQYRSQISSAEHVYASPLQDLRLSPQFYAGFLGVMDFILVMAFAVIGVIIHLQKTDDWMVLLISMACITFGLMFVPTLYLLSIENPIWQYPTGIIRAIGLALSLLVPFYLFPNGRFVPRITAFLGAVWLAMCFAWLVFPQLPANLIHVDTWEQDLGLSFGMYLFWYASGVAAQVYRYRKDSGVIERQQTKWVVLGTGAAVVGFILYHIPLLLFPNLNAPTVPGVMYAFIGGPLYKAATLLAPISLGISILRYRLWDVDIVINKSLVYAILMATLGAIFLGVLLGTRVFIFRLTGQTPRTITTILSTLLISALFNPMRSVIQASIDRRFFRQKYNSEEVLGNFGKRLRKEVNLDTLTADILKVVGETVQPESAFLWIRPAQEHEQVWEPAPSPVYAGSGFRRNKKKLNQP